MRRGRLCDATVYATRPNMRCGHDAIYDAVLWSLDFGVGVFHEFLLINFVGTS